jgi:hypothetical protein
MPNRLQPDGGFAFNEVLPIQQSLYGLKHSRKQIQEIALTDSFLA